MKRPRVQQSIDFLAGTSMTLAAVVIIWRLVSVSPPASPSASSGLPLPTVPVPFVGAPVEGDPNAPIGIIQYSEFECPFCGKFARETLPAVREKYLATGKAFLAFVHFPLERIHPRAAEAAALSKCAQDHGRFWPFHDRLFATPKPALDEQSLALSFEAAGLSPAALADCRASDALDRVRRELAGGRDLQVKSTPTFFFGDSLRDGTIRVRSRMSGALPVAAFDSMLRGLGREVAAPNAAGTR